MKLNFPLAQSSWGDEEIEALGQVIKTGHFTMGTFVAEYEKKFGEYLKSKYCVMCSSGSTANLLMIAALFYRKNNPLKRGDEIIVPAVSWSTTYFPLYQYGLKLKFVDIDPGTLNFDLDALKSAITSKTRAVLAVNLLGNPNDFQTIKRLIEGKNITLLEDNCESLGATYIDQQAGTFGEMGTFSSFFSHHISTMEGGLVCTDDEELYHILLCLRAHGWTRNLPKSNHVTGLKSDDDFDEMFKFVLPGYNVRPLEMEAAVGLEQLKKLPSFISTRRQNAKVFIEEFKDHAHLMIQEEIGSSSWFGFSFVIREDSKFERAVLVRKLSQAGVECRPIVAGNFAKNSVLKWFDYEIHGTLPNAERIDSHGFFIGNHHRPMAKDLGDLKKLIDRLS